VYDEKNIRRRVYDALNVLMAMDIIAKERKEIRWKGLPTSLQHDAEMLIVRVGAPVPLAAHMLTATVFI
jgi:hypothetical protein